MATKPMSRETAQAAVDAVTKYGAPTAAARALNIPRRTLENRLNAARTMGIGTPVNALDQAKRRILQLETDLRQATGTAVDSDNVRRIIGTIGSKLDTIEPPKWTYAPIAASAPGVPTLFLSDLHWGERVYSSQIGGTNAYSVPVAKKRLKYTVETAIHLLRILDNKMRYPGIIAPLGGDMISGNIHDELVATNELGSIPAMLDLHGELVAAIRLMADTFGAVFLPCVSGNHGRDTRKIWAKDRHHTSFDWLLYQFLAKTFAGDKRVTFFIPDGPDAFYKVYDYRFLLTHGDQFRGGDGIIGPLGPLIRGDQKKRTRNAQVGQEYDTMICGHWHQYITLRRLIVNGSLKGYDEYAFSNNFPFEEPTQALWVNHPRYGITYRMPVYCEQLRAPKSDSWVSVPRRSP